MRRWLAAPVPTHCGRCPSVVAIGAPYLAIQIAGMRRPLVRCRTCAGEPVPSELPGPVAKTPVQLGPWTPVSDLVPVVVPTVVRALSPGAQARLLARLAAIRDAGSREPGQEG